MNNSNQPDSYGIQPTTSGRDARNAHTVAGFFLTSGYPLGKDRSVVRLPPKSSPRAGRIAVETLVRSAGEKSAKSGLVIATAGDIPFLDDLQRRYRGCLGFLPNQALEFYTNTNNVYITYENGEPAGYVLGRNQLAYERRIRPIFQAAVAYDAVRRRHGLALVDQVCRDAKSAGQEVVQANCAADLEACEFWKAAGFVPIHGMQPPTASGRIIITWRISLVEHTPTYFTLPPQRAGHRAARPTHFLSPIRPPEKGEIGYYDGISQEEAREDRHLVERKGFREIRGGPGVRLPAGQ